MRRAGPANAFRGRLELYSRRLRPDAFFSHVTAARLLDIPVPLRLEREPLVHVAVLAPERAPHAKVLVGHRLDPATSIVTRHGLRVSAPCDTWRVVETETGHDVRVDLAYAHLKFAIEYQGDYHRSRSQWRRDMTRRTRLEADGWYAMELNADDLRDPVELIARIRTALARRR